MIHQYSAGIVIYRIGIKGLEYLLLHYTSGHWDFPKGKVEARETLEEAAIRELNEETALTAQLDPYFKHQLSYFFTDRQGNKVHKTVTFFVGQAREGTIVLSDEHQGYEWVCFTDGVTQVTYANAKTLLQEAHKYIMHLHQ